MNAIAACYEAFQSAMKAHDTANPDHTAYGIGLSAFDMGRLGFEDGETVLPGIRVEIANVTTSNFRVLCDGDHDGHAEEQEEVTRAVSDPNPQRSDPVFA